MKKIILLLAFGAILFANCKQEGASKETVNDADELAPEYVLTDTFVTADTSGILLTVVSESTSPAEKPLEVSKPLASAPPVREPAPSKPVDRPTQPAITETPTPPATTTTAETEPTVTIPPVPAEKLAEVDLIVPYSISGSGSNINVSGTSTLHDWTMSTASLSGRASSKFDNSGQLLSIDALNFSLPVATLKSKDEKMDKNARDALKADQHKNIDFKYTRATITSLGNNRYSIKAVGNLTIAGTTREINLDATGVVNANKSMTITGTHSFNMTEFNVKPPQFLLGTMKTGDRINLSYSLVLTP